MFDQDYFALRLVRLTPSEEWSSQKEGLYFVFLTGGSGQYVSGSAAQRLAPGDILVCAGSPDGKLNVYHGAEIIFLSFVLRLEHLLPLFAGSEISLLHEVTNHFKGAKLVPAATALAMKCHRLIEEVPPQLDLEYRSHLLRIAAAILNEEFRMAHHQRLGLGQVEERLIRVFEQLSVDQLSDLSVEQLASKFGCSRRHLNRLFHQYFGFSVGALRMEMRLLKAVTLLRDSDAKVINVAVQCGFNHLGLFNTCFKKRFGVSPGRWRKQAAPAELPPASARGDDSACPLQIKGLCPLAGAFENNVPLAVKISLLKRVPSAGTLPDLRAGKQPIDHHAPMTYPKASSFLPPTP